MTAGAGHDGGSNALVPCLLLFLRARQRDGEELHELVRAFGLCRQTNELNAILTGLEVDALVRSVARGPVRVYGLTDSGGHWLAVRAAVLSESARLVSRFLERYALSDSLPVDTDESVVR